MTTTFKITASLILGTLAIAQVYCGVHPFCDGSFSPAMSMTGLAAAGTIRLITKLWS